MPHEGNSENTFSLSGKLSNGNTHTEPDHLSRLVRINKNKGVCKPTHELLRRKYRMKFAASPEGEDVQSESDGYSEEDEQSESDEDSVAQ